MRSCSYTGSCSERPRSPDGSGVNREVHAPFCERPEVKLLRPTHPGTSTNMARQRTIAARPTTNRQSPSWTLEDHDLRSWIAVDRTPQFQEPVPIRLEHGTSVPAGRQSRRAARFLERLHPTDPDPKNPRRLVPRKTVLNHGLITRMRRASPCGIPSNLIITVAGRGGRSNRRRIDRHLASNRTKKYRTLTGCLDLRVQAQC
jgi:hypothetical protein